MPTIESTNPSLLGLQLSHTGHTGNAEQTTAARSAILNNIDRACQTDTPFVKPEENNGSGILEDYDFIINNDFSSLFKKRDKSVYEQFSSCQEKLKLIDRAFLKHAVDGNLVLMPTDKVSQQQLYIFDEVVELLSTTLDAINSIEPKPRLLLSIRLANIMAGIIVAGITVSMFLLPTLFPSFFVAGTVAYGVLSFFYREGALTLNISGIFLSIYQWIANKRDNHALQDFENFRDRFARINSYFDKMRSNEMFSQLMQFKSEFSQQLSEQSNAIDDIRFEQKKVTEQFTEQLADFMQSTSQQISNLSNSINDLKREQEKSTAQLAEQIVSLTQSTSQQISNLSNSIDDIKREQEKSQKSQIQLAEKIVSIANTQKTNENVTAQEISELKKQNIELTKQNKEILERMLQLQIQFNAAHPQQATPAVERSSASPQRVAPTHPAVSHHAHLSANIVPTTTNRTQ